MHMHEYVYPLFKQEAAKKAGHAVIRYDGRFWAFLTYFPSISQVFLHYFPTFPNYFSVISCLFPMYFSLPSYFSVTSYLFLMYFSGISHFPTISPLFLNFLVISHFLTITSHFPVTLPSYFLVKLRIFSACLVAAGAVKGYGAVFATTANYL